MKQCIKGMKWNDKGIKWNNKGIKWNNEYYSYYTNFAKNKKYHYEYT